MTGCITDKNNIKRQVKNCDWMHYSDESEQWQCYRFFKINTRIKLHSDSRGDHRDLKVCLNLLCEIWITSACIISPALCCTACIMMSLHWNIITNAKTKNLSRRKGSDLRSLLTPPSHQKKKKKKRRRKKSLAHQPINVTVRRPQQTLCPVFTIWMSWCKCCRSGHKLRLEWT